MYIDWNLSRDESLARIGDTVECRPTRRFAPKSLDLIFYHHHHQNVPGDPTTYQSVSIEQRLNSSPDKHKLSDGSCRKKGGGVASVESDAAAVVDDDKAAIKAQNKTRIVIMIILK